MTKLKNSVSHQRKTFAQIHAAHFWIVGQLAGLAVTENSAVVDDVGPVGHRKRFAHVVIRDQYSDATGPQVADYFLQVQHGNGIDPGKRLPPTKKSGVVSTGEGGFHS